MTDRMPLKFSSANSRVAPRPWVLHMLRRDHTQGRVATRLLARVATRLLARVTTRLLTIALVAFSLIGCSNPPRNFDAVRAYYNYDFPGARDALRGDAYAKNNEQTILNNTRLGIAA